MAVDFHEVQFPTDISYGSAGGPEFSTEVIELGSGYERRNQNWTYPRERWNVAYGVKTTALLQLLIKFFYARHGRAIGFRFKNPDDYTASGQQLGISDGSTVEYQLIKTYISGGQTLTRKISKPVSGTVHIYIDSVEQVSDWSVDTTTGIVTFGTAPGFNTIITADFEFDIPVRFDSDYLPMRLETYLARSAEVPIVEIRV